MPNIYNCLQCAKEVKRTPSKVESSGRVFCSSSCAAKYNNSHAKEGRKFGPAKRVFIYCKEKACGKLIKNNNIFCIDHRPMPKVDQKIGDVSKRELSRLARKVAKKLQMYQQCYICNYSKIVEVCHIKPVSSFTNDDLVSVVNGESNLIGLCPNHHWELDHNLLSYEDLNKIKEKLNKAPK